MGASPSNLKYHLPSLSVTGCSSLGLFPISLKRFVIFPTCKLTKRNDDVMGICISWVQNVGVRGSALAKALERDWLVL